MKNDEYLYCRCGYPVIVTYLDYKSQCIPIFRYVDTKRIFSSCPDCGDEFKRENLVELGELEIE